MKKKETELTYTKAFAELQTIMQNLENGEVSIDDLQLQLAKAEELLWFCRSQLRESKAKLESFDQNAQS